MEAFYIIQLTNKDGKVGYLTEVKNRTAKVVFDFTADIKQFSSQQKAMHYAGFKRLSRFGKIIILSNLEVIEQYEKIGGISPAEGPKYYLENDKGEKLFYSAERNGYFFDDQDAGYCFWNTRNDLQTFLDEVCFPFNTQIKELNT